MQTSEKRQRAPLEGMGLLAELPGCDGAPCCRPRPPAGLPFCSINRNESPRGSFPNLEITGLSGQRQLSTHTVGTALPSPS